MARPPDISKNASDPMLLHGDSLDMLGDMWHVHRCLDETDGQFRNRLERTITGRDTEEQPMGHLIEDEPRLEEMAREQLKVFKATKTGPHMYDAECQCDSCAEWTAKQSAGMNISIGTVRREAELCQAIAWDEYMGTYENNHLPVGYRHAVDPVMSIPASVVIALCDKAERPDAKPAQGHKRGGYGVNHWYSEHKNRCSDIKRLQAEIDRLKAGLGQQYCLTGPHRSTCTNNPTGQCVRTDKHECTGCEFYK